MKTVQTKNFQVVDLGLIDYAQAYAQQKQAVNDVMNGAQDQLILCRHLPVITLGRLAVKEHILVSSELLHEKGIEVKTIDRGGDITFHMPGQLVAYPIVNLNHKAKDLRVFLEKLEQVAIDLLLDFGIVAKRVAGQRGVWVDAHKIASIGIGVKRWVSYHGIALNVNPDLKMFSLIKPCGLDVTMTSMETCLQKKVSIQNVQKALESHFQKSFTF